MQYVLDILNSRHFWIHLSRSELRGRFRHSRLGILWALLQPLLLTLLISFVFGAVFRQPIGDFAPFVFSGILVWDFLSMSVVGGCGSIIAAGPYIKQRKLPIVIYPLKLTLTNGVISLIAFVGLLGWVLLTRPRNFGPPFLSLLLTVPILFAIGWPLAIISAFINTKFRDFQLFVGLVLQAIYFMSPVFIKPELFEKAGIGWVLTYNPVAHILQLVRAPLLEKAFPTLTDYGFAVGFAVLVWLVALYKMRREEADLIFYL